jgi:Tfp pilus assembly protein PilO
LPRIVTLHDFKISPGANSAELSMQILAKTYRYKGEE